VLDIVFRVGRGMREGEDGSEIYGRGVEGEIYRVEFLMHVDEEERFLLIKSYVFTSASILASLWIGERERERKEDKPAASTVKMILGERILYHR